MLKQEQKKALKSVDAIEGEKKRKLLDGSMIKLCIEEEVREDWDEKNGEHSVGLLNVFTADF